MRPSFFALFKRGKYFHLGTPLLARKGKRVRGDTREAERFAAAAVAFAWEHDEDFRKCFWRAICHRPGDPQLTKKATISVEPHRWADLLIVNPNARRRYVYVIECKIAAKLAPIQNPTTKAFASPGGYGRLFEDNESGKDSSLRFVVFGLAENLNLAKVDSRLRLKVHTRKWADLATALPQTPLSTDLGLSLGKLEIGAFPESRMKNMKISTKETELGKAVAILTEVQRRLDWPEGKPSARSFQLDEGVWSLGTDLKNYEAPNATRLKACLKPPESYLAWFGYQGEEAVPSQLAIWLYCGSKEFQNKVALLLSRQKFSAEKLPRDGKYFNVVVKARTHSENNDCDWFCSVLKALGLTLKQ